MVMKVHISMPAPYYGVYGRLLGYAALIQPCPDELVLGIAVCLFIMVIWNHTDFRNTSDLKDRQQPVTIRTEHFKIK